jgi:hypothetical protein
MVDDPGKLPKGPVPLNQPLKPLRQPDERPLPGPSQPKL